jgi:hypothetical protein
MFGLGLQEADSALIPVFLFRTVKDVIAHNGAGWSDLDIPIPKYEGRGGHEWGSFDLTLVFSEEAECCILNANDGKDLGTVVQGLVDKDMQVRLSQLDMFERF